MYKILIVEDDLTTRAAIASVIRTHPRLELVAEAGSCHEALQALTHADPQIALVDMGLPDGNGADLIRDMARSCPDLSIMVLSAFFDEERVLTAIQAGARSYLIKDGRFHLLAAAIDEMVAGGSPLSPVVARHLLKKIQPQPPMVLSEPLSMRELEILQWVARGFRYEEIAQTLKISYHTVAAHVRHIYQKLGVRSRSEATYEAINLGLVNAAPSDRKRL